MLLFVLFSVGALLLILIMPSLVLSLIQLRTMLFIADGVNVADDNIVAVVVVVVDSGVHDDDDC